MVLTLILDKQKLDLSINELLQRWNVIQSYHTECQNS
jgi:hypothetical protein